MRPSTTLTPPTRLWQFNRSALFDGDVVLEAGHGVKSWAITTFDGGPFSHALIWAGGTDFVESVGSGVRVLSIERVIIAEPNRWKLLRHSDREAGKQAALAARRMVGKYYNVAGALTSLSPSIGSSNVHQLFCSELIALAYSSAGIELISGCPPHKVTPRLLLESPVLSNVELPVVECALRSRERALELLNRDTAYAGSLMAVEAKATRAAFTEVEPLLRELPPESARGLIPPGNLHELINLLASLPIQRCRTVMDRLLIALQKSAYFHLLDDPLKEVRETFLQAGVQIRLGDMASEDRENLQTDMLERCRGYGETARRYLGNAVTCEKLENQASHGLWQELAAMYRRNYQQFLILRAMGQDMSSDAWMHARQD